MKSSITRLVVLVQAILVLLYAPTRAQNIWLNSAEIAALPITGPAWDSLKAAADKVPGVPDLSNHDDPTNVQIMAKALVFARTKDERYRNEVVAACMAAIGTEKNGDALALARELAAYVIAADLVGLPPAEDKIFREWLRQKLSEPLRGLSLRTAHEKRANNWGTHAGASRIAVAVYLGDQAEIARCAQVFKGWLGDREAYAGFKFGDLSWQADPNQPAGINAKGTMKNGHLVDGVLPDDQRRGGVFKWPPQKVNYAYGALQGAVVQAVILSRLGYETWNWQDQALLRAFQWLQQQANFAATGDDIWLLHLINRYYQTQFPAAIPSEPGKNAGWTDWTHATGGNGDNGVAGINLTESGGSTDVIERGTNDTFDIVLNSVPAREVELAINPDDQLDLGAGAGKRITLTFTPGTALTPQTVTVVAANDAITEGNHNGTIVFSATSYDAKYNGLSIASVVGITDAAMTMPQLVFLADELIKINSNAQSEGAIHSNGTIEFGKSLAGMQRGNLKAVGKITIAENNQIVGDVASGAFVSLLGNARVSGVITNTARIAKLPLPSLLYTAGGPSEEVRSDRALALQPGTYNKVEVKPKGTLILQTGDYYFNILDTDRSTRLSLDVTNGPVNIHVVSKLDFDDSVRVNVLGGSTDLVTFSTLQIFKVDVGKNATICGNLKAPYAEVHFETGCVFKGEVRAKAISLDPQVQFMHHHSTLPVRKMSEATTSEVATPEVVTDYVLEQNYPNPFNPITTIGFTLPQAGEVTLAIYNTEGQLVRHLIAGQYQRGHHRVRWDARDDNGRRVASGVYLYTLQAGEFVAKKKLSLLK